MRATLALALLSFFAFSGAAAQDQSDLAKKTQNPVGDLISVPFQSNFNGGFGPEDKLFYNLNIQPVYPMSLSEDWSLINRVIIPILDFPDPINESGLGDIQYQGYISPANPGKFIWGVGGAISFPTASKESLGAEKWSAGPGVVGLVSSGAWVVGALLNNVWSFAGSDDHSDVNQMLFQPFINYNLPSGVYLTTSPVITANWEADSGDRWTVPLGGGLGKILRLGKLPVNTQVAFYFNVEHPEVGPEWQTRVQFQFLFPK
jgi:hypothetical protein